MERLTNNEAPRGRFASPRDEVLYVMTCEGWSNQSDGNDASPTGWFARVSNSEAELASIVDTFGDDLITAEVAPSSLVGHFIMTESTQGFVSVNEYPTEDAAKADYALLAEEYLAWHGEDEV